MRFSKRITLFPGFRLNFGKTGVSATVGPRGCSIGIGKRGMFLSTSIPGTGVSYREPLSKNRLFSSEKNSFRSTNSEPELKYDFSKKLMIDEEHQLVIIDSDGQKISDYEEKEYRRDNRANIQSFLKNYAENFNQELILSTDQYLLTPKPNDNLFELPEFEVKKPVAPDYLEKSRVAKWFNMGHKIDIENEKLRQSYEIEKKQHDELWQSFLNNKKNFLEELYSAQTGNIDAMEKTLGNLLNEIQWEKETIISFEINNSGDVLSVDVDLPEIEDIPNKIASVIERGLKLKVINKTSRDVNEDYKRCVFSILFRISGLVFCALPTIHTLTLSGYTQRIDKATAKESDEYIVSAIVHRKQWEIINFESLDKLDPFLAFHNFDLRFGLEKNGLFSTIIPF